MHAVIFIGIQASGKSTFYKEHFFNTHVRISLDLFRTRHRESLFLQTCYRSQMRFVVDNTNPATLDRTRYIKDALTNRFKVSGYFFDTTLEDALERNHLRRGKDFIPPEAIITTMKKLVSPKIEEGFHDLHKVLIKDGRFYLESM